MPLILGGDIASVSGLCLMETSRPKSEWWVFALRSEGEEREEKAGDIALFLYDLFTKPMKNPRTGIEAIHRPDFAVLETPMRNVKQFGKMVPGADGKMVAKETVNPNALLLSTLAGGVVATFDICGVPWGTLYSASWRKAYFGAGRKPPEKWDSSKKKMVADWKTMAIVQAELEGVQLPDTVEGKADAAEAVGIAVAWKACQTNGFIPERHKQAFMNLRTGKIAA